MPTLNEAAALPAVLDRVTEAADEVIVSDGGSTDGTAEVARSRGVRVVEGSPGRGPQLNRGAASADGDVLLFLHADTHLGDGALDAVRSAALGGAPGGGFLVRFESDESRFHLGSRIVNLRTRLTRCPLGDQAQFARSEVFAALGGFREWPVLEDLDFARRLKRIGSPAILEPVATTSPRRFLEQGVTRTIIVNWTIWALYFLGVSPHRLARLYRPRAPR